MIRSWHRLGLAYKFSLSFCALVLVIVVVFVVSTVSLRLVRDAEEDIQASMELRQKVLEMDGRLERAKRLYRDFLLNSPQIGFARARELYLQPAIATAAKVIALNEELKRLLVDARVGDTLRQRNVDLNLYLSLAKRYSTVLLDQYDLLATLSDENTGLFVQLDAVMARLRRIMQGDNDAIFQLREAALLEKEYRITRQRPHMQSALNGIGQLRQAILDSPRLSDAHKREALAQCDAYTNIAGRILAVDVAITSNSNDFALQATAADAIAENLKALAAAEVRTAQDRIRWVGRVAGGIFLVAILFGIGGALAVATIMHTSVIRRIVDMTRHASQLRDGNLESLVTAGGGDELGVLADTFNAMTRRLKDLVENLEEKVRQRTLALAESNRRLDAQNHILEKLSQTDRLTGLCNRRKLDQTLMMELRRARRYNTPFSLIMVDVDHFKDVNDRFGHQAGDTVLCRLAEVLLVQMRDTDVLGRWGGEEFLLICPETVLKVAVSLAGRLRREVAHSVYAVPVPITASFGVAQYVPGDDPTALISRVDAALYRAKLGGRNRVERVDGDEQAAASPDSLAV